MKPHDLSLGVFAVAASVLQALAAEQPRGGLPRVEAQPKVAHRDPQVRLGTAAPAALASPQPPRGYYRFPAIRGDTIVFTAEGDLWRVGLPGGVAARLTTHPGTEAHAVISPDGLTLAFSAEYEGPQEVYVMPLGGGVPRRLTFEGDARTVGWTPDGMILYATRAYSTLPNEQLMRLDPATACAIPVPLSQASEGAFLAGDGPQTLVFTRLPFQGSSTKRYRGGTAQNLWRFTQGQPEAVPLTADYPGTSKNPMPWQGRVYFVTDRDGIMNLWSMTPDGGELRQHTHHAVYDVKSAALDRGRIVYQHGADLRLYDIAANRDTLLPVVLATDFDQMRERWIKKPLDYLTSAHLSPDGDRVVLTARGQVFVAPVKPGRFVAVPKQHGVRYRSARFLPDGKHLVALSDKTGELEFWELPANGVGDPVPLTRDGRVFRYPAVPSPDGRWLAWYDKNHELWVLNRARRDSKRVATSLRYNFTDLAWSPDSQWLAYVHAATNAYRQIHLCHLPSTTITTLTTDRTDSFSPAWTPDGKWLYFLSDRHLRSLQTSPWGPRQPDPYFTDTTKIYQLALTPALRSPFRAPDELARSDAKPKTPAAPPVAQPAATTNETKQVRVTIDLPGLAARLEEVPVKAGNYDALQVAGKRLLYTARGTGFEAKTDLIALDITNHDAKPKTLVPDIRAYELSLDGKKIGLRKAESYYVIAASAKAPATLAAAALNLAGWTFPIMPREEWRQIYTESWRLLRDHFYDRNMHGADWQRVHDKYLPLVDRVADRADLSDVIAEMAGELSALHIFVRYGDEREGSDQVQPAALGARFERDPNAGGWRVAHVYQADPDYPAALSPLARPGVGVNPGDVILRINGQPTLAADHPRQWLRHQAGNQVLLEVKSPKSDKPRPVIVEPITADAEANLRYDEWEFTRRQRVESAGKGQIGYVHLRAMGAADIAAWARDFYPVYMRQGLIIDVRHNRGGNIDSWILGKLLRQAWFYWQPRVGIPYWNMQYAFRGHMVVLCNERTASDGEAFTEGFRRLRLGKSIGTRTWGGEIWLSAQRWLVDSGMATAAETGVYGPDGDWLIEGHGVDPDIVVDNLPHATFNGADAQLDAAIRHLQHLIAKDPRPVTPTPQYPVKTP
ncbi:MAG: PD40 domain-containing protein [Verrucomicrobia bacterium]|nr:PD40 domain-containing protein [Verrucomicrobiota bacterium]